MKSFRFGSCSACKSGSFPSLQSFMYAYFCTVWKLSFVRRAIFRKLSPSFSYKCPFAPSDRGRSGAVCGHPGSGPGFRHVFQAGALSPLWEVLHQAEPAVPAARRQDHPHQMFAISREAGDRCPMMTVRSTATAVSPRISQPPTSPTCRGQTTTWISDTLYRPFPKPLSTCI